MSCKVYADELTSALQASSFKSLQSDGEDSTKLVTTISEFQANCAGKLQGETWKVAFAKLDTFSEALNTRVNISSSISGTITEALTILLNYMEDYPMLDSSKLDKIIKIKNQCEKEIEQIKSIMYSKTTVEEIDPATNQPVTREVNLYNSDEIAAFAQRIDELEKSLVDINKLIDKLKGLDEVYARAESKLSKANEEIQKFKTQVNDIKPSCKVMYSR